MSQPVDLNTVLDEARAFPADFRSLHLATCNAAGEPDASYAAYVAFDGCYYVYTSELTAHTTNLKTTGRCSVLFIESEAQAKQIFARRRLTLQCSAVECLRGSPEFEVVLDLFAARFGDFIDLLRQLTDFHLYQLRPRTGSYVVGFGRAYTLEGEGLGKITHRMDAAPSIQR